MENTEIPQQVKQDVFETAELKTIVSKTPEEKERIQKIKRKIIDIHKYQGIIQHTQIPNLANILIEGIKRGKDTIQTRSVAKSGWTGTRGGLGSETSWLTFITTKTSSFHNWTNIPWDEAGPLALLFAIHKSDNIGITDVICDVDKKIPLDLIHKYGFVNLYDYLKFLKNKDSKYEALSISTSSLIPSESIIGIIISPKTYKLETTNKNVLLSKSVINQDRIFITIPTHKTAEFTANRLYRLFYKKPDTHLVPLYDHLGNVLWPEKIPYEEVQKMVITKTKLP